MLFQPPLSAGLVQDGLRKNSNKNEEQILTGSRTKVPILCVCLFKKSAITKSHSLKMSNKL